jgi:hypothetical protein
MGIRQLPSGAFQGRFQHHRTSYVATYPTRELAEEAEPLLRAAVLTGRHDETDADRDTIDVPPPTGPAPGSRLAPSISDQRNRKSASLVCRVERPQGKVVRQATPLELAANRQPP